MLIDLAPNDWKSLQEKVARTLAECGMETAVEHPLPNVRGQANIDVHAIDSSTQPPTVYLCECKHWASAVPQNIIHGFRQVVTDSGANWSLVIARSGFQSGAHQAAEMSNVRLLSWDQFSEMFAERWINNYLLPTLCQVNEPLADYTEPYSAKVIRHPMPFDDDKRKEFAALLQKHQGLAGFCLNLCHNYWPLSLPLRSSWPKLAGTIPEKLMDETVLRPFWELLKANIESALMEFDSFFGGRIS